MDAESENQEPIDIRKMSKEEKALYFDNWKNKRKMAWVALISMLIVTCLLMFVITPDRLTIISEPIIWFFFSMASIVGAYMGFSVLASNLRK